MRSPRFLRIAGAVLLDAAAFVVAHTVLPVLDFVLDHRERAALVGHYYLRVYVGVLVFAVAMFALTPSEGTHHINTPTVSTALIFLIGTVACLPLTLALLVHDESLCVPCMKRLSRNPSRAATRRKPLLWSAHHVVWGVALVCALLVAPVPRFLPFAVILAEFWAHRAHRRFKPWCPWCRDGGGGLIEMPTPDPSTRIPAA